MDRSLMSAQLPGLDGIAGGVVAVTSGGTIRHREAFGHFTFAADSPVVAVDTSFDLASLTKVVATTAMAMLLFEQGKLVLDKPVSAVVPEFAGADLRRATITLAMLLAHSSGLPAHERFFERHHTKKDVLRAVMATPLKWEPLTHVEYSDIGFMILGMALERLADEPLESFCRSKIFEPLEMTRTGFNPPPSERTQIPPTLKDYHFRHRVIQGEVNDENAYVLGGVSAHAGLFAPADDVARFALCMLRGGSPILRPETVRLFTERQATPRGTSRALGWDTPSTPSQSGKYFSPQSYGHLGYTGTSLWIDPERDVSITLLTNRTWPDANSQVIKQMRPAVHDAMMEAVLSTSDLDLKP